MEKGKGLKTIRVNKQEEFDILYQNPGGARYHQDGKFYGVGGCYLKDQTSVSMGQLPLHVQEKILKNGGLKPYGPQKIKEKELFQEFLESRDTKEEKIVVGKVEETEKEKNPYQCPHCDKSYKDKQWYDRHLATHEIDE